MEELMFVISPKKNYKISVLVLSLVFISACDLTPRSLPEKEEIYTDDLLFYDDQLDLAEYLNPQITPEITPDLSQVQIKKNPEKVSIIGRNKLKNKPKRKQVLYLQEDITQNTLGRKKHSLTKN